MTDEDLGERRRGQGRDERSEVWGRLRCVRRLCAGAGGRAVWVCGCVKKLKTMVILGLSDSVKV